MAFQDLSIKKKVVAVTMLASISALLLAAVGLMAYDWLTFRRTMIRNLAITASIIADNGSFALLNENEQDLSEILDSLHADPHIREAAFYTNNSVIVRYPANELLSAFPERPGPWGSRFEGGFLESFTEVKQHNQSYGALFLRSDLGALFSRLRLYGEIAGLVLIISGLLALGIARSLQQRITQPILALAATARAVTERSDYSVRAPATGGDELGALTEAFNRMLTRIESQTQALQQAEQRRMFLAALVESSDDAVVGRDLEGRIVSWNAGAEKMFGYTAVEVIGQPMSILVRPDRPGEAEELLQAAKAGQTRHLETVRVRKGGQLLQVSLTVSPIRSAAGELVGVSSIARDISAGKAAERELHESRARLSAIIGSAMDAIISVDSAQKITIFNEAAEKMFGCTATKAIGQSLDRFIPERYRRAHRHHIEEFGLTGVTTRAMGNLRPVSGVRSDGEEFPIEASISQLEINGQRVFTVILRDITERLRDQRELRRSETQLRLIWENALDAMRLVDEFGIVRMVNEAFCRLVGKSRSALEGQPLSALYKPERAAKVMSEHRQRFCDRSVPPHLEREVTLWNGKHLILELSNSFLNLEGHRPLLVTVMRDITERKLSEKREAAFSRLARSLSEATSAGAAARVIAEVADQIIGWDSFSLDLYSSESDLIHPLINIDNIQGKRTNVRPALSGESPTPMMRRILEHGGELLLRQPPIVFSPETAPFGDTSRPSASLIYVPIRFGQKAIGIISVQSYIINAYQQQDLTTLQTLADQCGGALERVRAEEQLRRMNVELEHHVRDRTAELTNANKELEAFTYSVAHDLRAPLRHMDAFSRLLEEDFGEQLAPDAMQYLHSIRKASGNMSMLVDDLLNLARVGRQELKRQPTPLSGLVEAVVGELQREAEGRSIQWRIEPLPIVECDAGLMKLVFTNLLSNAVKYTRPRLTAVIEVGCRKGNSASALFVRDNGVGFSMKYADKLFGVFQRLHRSEDFEGTGVGLATVERILRKHGGSIRAEAAVDAGATFYFTLPGL